MGGMDADCDRQYCDACNQRDHIGSYYYDGTYVDCTQPWNYGQRLCKECIMRKHGQEALEQILREQKFRQTCKITWVCPPFESWWNEHHAEFGPSASTGSPRAFGQGSGAYNLSNAWFALSLRQKKDAWLAFEKGRGNDYNDEDFAPDIPNDSTTQNNDSTP